MEEEAEVEVEREAEIEVEAEAEIEVEAEAEAEGNSWVEVMETTGMAFRSRISRPPRVRRAPCQSTGNVGTCRPGIPGRFR